MQKFMPVDYLYSNIFEVSAEDKPGNVDCYTAGFPCQPFSMAGKGLGENDPAGRGIIVWHAVAYIVSQRPKFFILENVKGLVGRFPDLFNTLIDTLRSIPKLDGKPAYECHWHVMDTSVEGALPQSRKRVYIIGLLRSEMRTPFTWPGALHKVKPLNEILNDKVGDVETLFQLHETAQNNILKVIGKMDMKNSGDIILDAGGSAAHWMTGKSPCLTASRAGARNYFSVARCRMLDCNEMMGLQGIEPSFFQGWEKILSERKMGMIIGNAMSLSIVERIMHNGMKSLGFKVKADRWAQKYS